MVAYQASERGGIIMCKHLGDKVLISGCAVTTFEGYLKISALEEVVKNVA